MKKSIMWEYIQEEKECLRRLLLDDQIKRTADKVKDMRAIYMVAHGSSYNAASAVSSFFTKMTGIRAYAFTPAGFQNHEELMDCEEKAKTCVLGISQTGTSRGVLEALQSVKDKAGLMIALTNEQDSPIDRLSDETLLFQCGEEDSNAKTKGYGCTLLLLLLLALESGKRCQHITSSFKEEVLKEIQSSMDSLDELYDKVTGWCTQYRYGEQMKELYVIGSGMNAATAMEGQLKVMETLCVPTMFNDIVEFSHGMHRAIHKDSHVILLQADTDKELFDQTYDYLKAKKVPVVMITSKHQDDSASMLCVPYARHTQSLLVLTYAIQIISVFVPELHGLDPNRNANNDYTDYVSTRI